MLNQIKKLKSNCQFDSQNFLCKKKFVLCWYYTEATLKFLKLNTQAQQREAVV
ncbi:MAG: hypothetical protein LBJ00_07930 [Planctomycetaceae bacterium]|nr:hypothetical protein [Planctomycetaceae bacterium]